MTPKRGTMARAMIKAMLEYRREEGRRFCWKHVDQYDTGDPIPVAIHAARAWAREHPEGE